MEESDKGGKLISSIESVDFSVGSDKDVEINVKDTRDWQLDPASTTVWKVFVFFFLHYLLITYVF